MLFKVGEKVRWDIISNGRTIKRAGIIRSIVPANADPRKFVPEGFTLVTRSDSRDHVSYLIEVPTRTQIYWPSVFILDSLPPEEDNLLYTQELSNKLKVKAAQDHSDRNIIRQLCKLFNLIYGDEWFETDNFITIPAWKRRFWFKVAGGVEYISMVETFKF